MPRVFCGFSPATPKGCIVTKNITTQVEALEIAMRLHEKPMQDPNKGVQQIHAQLQNIFLEMQNLKQDRTVQLEAREEI